jgi:hypothetical protein
LRQEAGLRIDDEAFMGIIVRARRVEVVMANNAAQVREAGAASASSTARVVDIRTGKPWRPPEPRRRSFLVDVAVVFILVTLGAWLFLKMQGG